MKKIIKPSKFSLQQWHGMPHVFVLGASLMAAAPIHADTQKINSEKVQAENEHVSGKSSGKSNAATIPAEPAEPADENRLQLDSMTITGGKAAIQTTPGSAHLVDEAALEVYEYTDIHQILTMVPGVYIRTEDGYGLRPNIGIRGAAAERSQKITLLEDGFLIKPAPYSAPSAYYFPSVSRMAGVEVFKGPVAIQYGPNSVGGAINLVTQSIPDTESPSGEIALGLGTDNLQRLGAHVGATAPMANDEWSLGWMLSGYHLSSDGFKDLDAGGDTGFERQDLLAKFSMETLPGADRYQQWMLKLGYAEETSDETYLGLTDADFAENPTRRYSASQLDKMNWDHQLIQLRHTIELGLETELTTSLYHNRFERAWDKFEDFHGDSSADLALAAFNSAPFSVTDVLDNPSGLGESRYYNLLTGAANSDGSERQKLDVTNNDRQYVSQGIGWKLSTVVESGSVLHAIDVGLRFHNDYVERSHTVKAYNMSDNVLVFDDVERAARLINKDESDAIAAYVHDTVTLDNWTFTAGLRGEHIDTTSTNGLDASKNSHKSESVLLPGIGALYQWRPEWAVLAGVHKGFSPSGPSAGDAAEPEETVNWEAGFRFRDGQRYGELIGFFSDYKNLTDRCGFSDSGCELGQGFNAGAVEIAGLELTAGDAWRWKGWQIPLTGQITYTESAFQTSFSSSFSQWGNVQKGDELPYIPDIQVRLETGLRNATWGLNLGLTHRGEMRESPGQGAIDTTEFVKSLTTVDASVAYWYSDALRLQLNMDNVFDKAEIVSRRPFGARPNKPRTIAASILYQLE